MQEKSKVNIYFSVILLIISVAWLLQSFAQLPQYLTYGQWFSIYAIIISIWLIVRELMKN